MRRETQMANRKCLVGASLALVALTAAPAVGRPVDLVKAGRRLGPIRLFETTLGEAKSWFGAPSVRRRVRLGCIRALEVKWGKKLLVYFETAGDHDAVQGEIRRRRLRSNKHGLLRLRTVKGLRVGDGHRRLRRLYPKANAERHGDHFDYFLRSSADGGRLVALTKYRKGRVRGLFAGPYETC